MHELFRIEDRLPVDPGKTPFHFRGFYYDRLILRMRRECGSLDPVLEELTDERVRAFIRQKFSWNGWYDAFPSMPLYAAFARVRNQDFERSVREGTRKSALDLVPRFMRLTFHLFSPAVLASNVSRAVMQTADFGRVKLDHMGEAGGAGRGSGLPLYIAPNLTNLALGAFTAMLEIGGAKDVHARYTDVFEDGRNGPFSTVTVCYEFRWTPRSALRRR